MSPWQQFIASPAHFELALFLISIGAGVFGAILGLGGGVIIVPVLTLLFGVNIRYAVGASIVSVIATSSGAAASYVKDRVTNIRVGMLLEVATSTGALAAAMIAPFVSQHLLFLIFSIILIYASFIMMRKRKAAADHITKGDRWSERLRLNSSYPDHALGHDVDYAVTGVPLGLGLSVGAGAISGLLGIGGGPVKVPLMDSAMKLPIKVSSATSNFMIGVTAAASAGAYFMRGDIIPFIAAPVALGVLTGATFGSRLMMRLKSIWIRKLFVAVLVIIALEMGLKAFR